MTHTDLQKGMMTMKHKHNLFRWIMLLLVFSLLANTASVSAASKKKRKKTEAVSKYSLNMISTDLLLSEDTELTVEGITDETVSFKSSDSDVVSVDSGDSDTSCQLTGKNVGNATITVKIKEKGFLFFNSTTTTLTCKVTVTPWASSIRFNRKQIKMAPNTRKHLKITLRPSITTEEPVFTSSDPNIVKVNAFNKIVAKSPGTAVITATIRNGNTASCCVIVTEK